MISGVRGNVYRRGNKFRHTPSLPSPSMGLLLLIYFLQGRHSTVIPFVSLQPGGRDWEEQRLFWVHNGSSTTWVPKIKPSFFVKRPIITS